MNAKDILTAAKNIGKFSSPQPPLNNVSQFVAETFDKLFGAPKGELVIVKNIMVMQANANPVETGAKLVTYHRMFEEWFYANKKVQEETQ
jgi:hypothetical protein